MSEDQRLERRLMTRFGEAIGDFGLIEPGDRILVGALPIPARRGARPGDRLPVIAGAAGIALAAALGPGDGTGPGD